MFSLSHLNGASLKSSNVLRLSQLRSKARVTKLRGFRNRLLCNYNARHYEVPVAANTSARNSPIPRHGFPSTNINGLKTSVQSKFRPYSAASTRIQNNTKGNYEPPQHGFVSMLPSSWIPYAELIRLDKPTGTYYLFFPCLFSTLMAAQMTTPMISPLEVVTTSALFFAGALVMRGAGCTINDLWDRNLDPHVERTKYRPIARGAISPSKAITFLGLQLLTGFGILLQFPTPCLYYGIPSLLLVGLYPLAKRVTNYPQFVLGLTFSWGAIMGFPAVGVDLLSNTPALCAAAALYASCVAWTVNYDMIYAHMDIKDDVKVGIKSIARAHEHNTKAVLAGLSVAQISLLAAAGYFVNAGAAFYLGSCMSGGLVLAMITKRVRLKSVGSCLYWFQRGAWAVGGVISSGLLLDYSFKRIWVEQKDLEETSL